MARTEPAKEGENDHSSESESIVSDLEDAFDIDLFSDEIYGSKQGSSHNKVRRSISRTDANSIVGGQSLENIYKEDKDGVVARDDRTAQEQAFKGHPEAGIDVNTYEQTQKVFPFSLPFGGLTSFRENIYKQIQSFKLENHFPTLQSDQEREEIRTKLERQESISTVDEAKYYKNVKKLDDVRFRAVKHSFTANLNEIIPNFISANKKEKPWESIYNEIDGNIVIMGGFRGSTLRETKTGKRVWIPFKAGFNLRRINLLLGPTQEDELHASDFIYPDGVLKSVGPVDICRKFIKKLAANPKTLVKEFGYDWRLSGKHLSRQLEQFLSEIYEKTGKPTLVIAHSMGGMIAHLTMQRNPKLFRSIVYVGSPSECLNILGPIRYGDSVLFSDKILTFETNFMMRSSFNFLPLSGRVFVNKHTHKWYDLDLFDPETWVEYNLNPLVSLARKMQELKREASPLSEATATDSTSSFSSINNISLKLKNYTSKSISRKMKPGKPEPISSGSTLPDPRSTDKSATQSPRVPSSIASPLEEQTFSFLFTQAYSYLCETLKQAKEFVLALDYREDLACEYPPLAVVYGNTVPSVRGSVVSSRQDIEDGNYYEFFYGRGDGVIHQKWLLPETKGFRFYNEKTGEGEIVGKFDTDCGHVNLMTDLKVMGNALSAVWEAEKYWDEKKRKQAQRMKQRKRSTQLHNN